MSINLSSNNCGNHLHIYRLLYLPTKFIPHFFSFKPIFFKLQQNASSSVTKPNSLRSKVTKGLDIIGNRPRSRANTMPRLQPQPKYDITSPPSTHNSNQPKTMVSNFYLNILNGLNVITKTLSSAYKPLGFEELHDRTSCFEIKYKMLWKSKVSSSNSDLNLHLQIIIFILQNTDVDISLESSH